MCFADSEVRVEGLKKRLKMAEGHIEAGRLLSFYQVCTSRLEIMILILLILSVMMRPFIILV